MLVGKLGSMKIGANSILNIKDWKISETCKTDEGTNFGSSGHEEHMATIDGATVTFSGQWNILADTTGQALCLNGTTVALKLYVDSTKFYTGSFIIDKVDTSAAVNKIITVDFSGKLTGALTKPV